MSKEEDIELFKKSISVEHFETFDADAQVCVLNKIKMSIICMNAFVSDFPPKYLDDILDFLEYRLNELQTIHNMRTNKRLDDFFK